MDYIVSTNFTEDLDTTTKRGVKAIFIEGHISNMVSLKGPGGTVRQFSKTVQFWSTGLEFDT